VCTKGYYEGQVKTVYQVENFPASDRALSGFP
jgi:hypothetical protein